MMPEGYMSFRTFFGQRLEAQHSRGEWTCDAFVGDRWRRYTISNLGQLWATVKRDLRDHGPNFNLPQGESNASDES